MNIYQRINAVMKDVTYVKKDKAVSGGGANYRAVTHDQLISVIRASLVTHGIVVQPTQTSGEFLVMRDLNATPAPVKMGLYTGTYDIAFINMDKPEDRSIISVQAHANDNGDKAPGKCITYAVKTAMLKQFALETGENDESRQDIAETQQGLKPITAVELKELTDRLESLGRTEEQTIQFLSSNGVNVNSLAELNQASLYNLNQALGSVQ